MSDYLGNLVARSLGPVPGVLPRTSSVFEPSSLAAQVTAEDEFVEENPAAPAPRFPDADMPAPPPRSNSVPSQVPRSEATRTSAEDLATKKDRARGQEPETDVRPEPSLRPDSSPRNEERDADTPRPAIYGKSSPPPVAPRASFDSEPAIADAREKVSRLPSPISPKPVSVPAPEVRKREPLAAAARSAVVPAVRLATPIPPRSSTPQAPTINVTIGRVEVRAVSPSARPRAPAKVPAGLSLHDYLRKRANGGGQ